MIIRHGADKFLFGSDNPWQSPRQAQDYLLSLDLDEDDLEKIKHKNAERVLGI